MELKSLVNAMTRKGQRLLMPLSALLIMLYAFTFGIIVYYSFLHIDKVYQRDVQKGFNEVESFYAEQIEDQKELQELIIYSLLTNPQVTKAFKETSTFDVFDSTFQRLTENNISHLYFIDTERVVMYRAHSPNKLGDTIDRATMLQASSSGKIASGLEFGVLGTFTLRTVSPVMEDERLLGYLEVGMELGHIARKTERQFSIALIEFFDKSLIDVDNTLNFMEVAGRQSDISTDPTYLINHNPELPLRQETILNLKQQFNQKEAQQKILETTAMMTTPLRDYSDQQVGYMAFIQDISALKKERTNTIAVAVLTILVLGSLTVAIFTYVLRFVEVVVRDYLTEINAKANELSQSLQKLESTQAMMIEQEKFASLGSMVAGIAHEINTPIGISLTAATSLSDEVNRVNTLFDEKGLTRSELDRFMQHANESSKLIERNLNRGADLVQSFKQVAVDQSSGVRRQVVFKALLEEIVLSMRPQLKRTEHSVNISCDPELSVETVPGFWTQIVINLINNSLCHGFDGIVKGSIHINVLHDEQRIHVKFSDDGVGIPVSAKSQIFEPFYTTKRNTGGSGLGLHLVYNLVSRGLKGSIELAKSRKSTVFNIAVPKNV